MAVLSVVYLYNISANPFISDGICSAFTSILSYRPAGAIKNPRTAQLTIFYAGMVNVYDDVPFDKVSCCFNFNFISLKLSSELVQPHKALLILLPRHDEKLAL